MRRFQNEGAARDYARRVSIEIPHDRLYVIDSPAREAWTQGRIVVDTDGTLLTFEKQVAVYVNGDEVRDQ